MHVVGVIANLHVMHCDESAQTLKYTTKYSNQYIIIFHGALALCLARSVSLSLSLSLALSLFLSLSLSRSPSRALLDCLMYILAHQG